MISSNYIIYYSQNLTHYALYQLYLFCSFLSIPDVYITICLFHPLTLSASLVSNTHIYIYICIIYISNSARYVFHVCICALRQLHTQHEQLDDPTVRSDASFSALVSAMTGLTNADSQTSKAHGQYPEKTNQCVVYKFALGSIHKLSASSLIALRRTTCTLASQR